MRGNEELSAWGRESLAGAEAVFVGSAHIREVLEDVVGHVDRVHEVPPGVPHRRVPSGAARGGAPSALLDEVRRDPPNPANANERLPDEGNAERLAVFFEQSFGPDRPVLREADLQQKGVEVLLLEVLHIWVDGEPAVIVGFGDYRVSNWRRSRRRARALHRRARTSASEASAAAVPRPSVVPSIFPEAFGMVAAEAAAAGSPPLVARHSGLAEIADGLEAAYRRRSAISRASSPPTAPSSTASSGACSHSRRRRGKAELSRAGAGSDHR